MARSHWGTAGPRTAERLRPLLEELAASVLAQAIAGQQEDKRLRAELKQVETERGRFYQAIAGGIAAANVAKPIEERQARKTEIEKQLAKLDRTKSAPCQIELTEEAVAFYIRSGWERID